MKDAPRDGTQVWLFAEQSVPRVWEWSEGKWRRGNGVYWTEDGDKFDPEGWLPAEPPVISLEPQTTYSA